MTLPLLHYGLRGKAQISVIERGRVVREYPALSNLILNQGLDTIASSPIADCFKFCAAGTGSTATETDGGSETANIVSGTLTLSTIGFLVGDSTDTGKVFKLVSSGGLYTVAAPISTTQCSVLPATTIGPENFVLYNTNQTGLTTESTLPGPSSKRSNTYLTGAPYCQTVTTGATTVLTRTFDFVAETGSITYNEVGFSSLVTIGSNLFSRVKLPAGVPLVAGQQLRVQYSVAVTVGPITPLAYGTSPIIGWPTATGTMQHNQIPMAAVLAAGDTATNVAQGSDGRYCMPCDPASASLMTLSINADPHGTYGAENIFSTELNNQASGLSVYVAGSYTRDRFTVFPVGSSNASTWRCFGVVIQSFGGQHWFGPRFLFDTAQTKLSTHTLTLGFRSTWGRLL